MKVREIKLIFTLRQTKSRIPFKNRKFAQGWILELNYTNQGTSRVNYE